MDPRIHIAETLSEPLRYLGLARADRDARVREVISRLGLTERVLDQFPMELIAGQQQRVGIGRAIITKTELLSSTSRLPRLIRPRAPKSSTC